jgi:benzoate 4-monooxygenase
VYLLLIDWPCSCTGDLAFGSPFGMLSGVTESTPVVASMDKGISSYSSGDVHSMKYNTINSVEVINEASAFGTFLSSIPSYIRPVVMNLPTFRHFLRSRNALSAMAVTAVSKRINSSKPIVRADFLTQLLAGRDAQGNPMQGAELSSEALTLLVAGSDTTAK